MARANIVDGLETGKVGQGILTSSSGSGKADPVTTAIGIAGQAVATGTVQTAGFVARHPVDAGIAVAGAVLTVIPATTAVGIGLDITAGIAVARDIEGDVNKASAQAAAAAKAQAAAAAKAQGTSAPSAPIPTVATAPHAPAPVSPPSTPPATLKARDWVSAFLGK